MPHEHDQPASDTCQRCKRPFGTVDDMRKLTLNGKCFTQYAYRDPDAAKDCEAAAWLLEHTPSSEQLQEMAASSTPPPELIGVQEEKPWAAKPTASEPALSFLAMSGKSRAIGCSRNDGGRGPHDFGELNSNGVEICRLCRLPREAFPVAQPAASDATGRELPDAPGFWEHNGQTWMVTKTDAGQLFAARPSSIGHGVQWLNVAMATGEWHPSAPRVQDGEGERLRDLVRYCRAELHDAGLISDEEFADLVKVGSESARRLESYDAMKATNAALAARLEGVGKLVEKWNGLPPGCSAYDCADELEAALKGV
jgi:hypothetical protein